MRKMKPTDRHSSHLFNWGPKPLSVRRERGRAVFTMLPSWAVFTPVMERFKIKLSLGKEKQISNKKMTILKTKTRIKYRNCATYNNLQSGCLNQQQHWGGRKLVNDCFSLF